jgi:hypothetical protein
MPDIKGMLTKKVGPFPTYYYIVGGGVVLLVWQPWAKKGQKAGAGSIQALQLPSAKAGSQQGVPSGGGFSGGGSSNLQSPNLPMPWRIGGGSGSLSSRPFNPEQGLFSGSSPSYSTGPLGRIGNALQSYAAPRLAAPGGGGGGGSRGLGDSAAGLAMLAGGAFHRLDEWMATGKNWMDTAQWENMTEAERFASQARSYGNNPVGKDFLDRTGLPAGTTGWQAEAAIKAGRTPQMGGNVDWSNYNSTRGGGGSNTGAPGSPSGGGGPSSDPYSTPSAPSDQYSQPEDFNIDQYVQDLQNITGYTPDQIAGFLDQGWSGEDIVGEAGRENTEANNGPQADEGWGGQEAGPSESDYGSGTDFGGSTDMDSGYGGYSDDGGGYSDDSGDDGSYGGDNGGYGGDEGGGDESGGDEGGDGGGDW